jgi:hypothetical protein
MGKRKPMKPMYRTAAEEALILAAENWHCFTSLVIRGEHVSTDTLLHDAVDAVVRERKEATK